MLRKKESRMIMIEEKYPMYISINHKMVLTDPHASTWEYKVEVTREAYPVFEKLFSQMEQLEFQNFLRSHLPYIPYHYDQDNDKVDLRLKKIFALIHEYTDDESKRFIEQLPLFR
ncbi:transposase [Sporosarcina sp. P12(2017)]|uniref:Transposase n=2 Tax=Caryophanaceae TaxID=186818 RepID=A0ABM6K085_SPOUR|nr:transposase [Sporosarcina ureae]PIC56090.1 transposase [Sporosarcina sp. P10]PIC59420.1 transposase [Sporosarcina sp. P12(2017)]PIC76564.1 transposase [Sporosarcina sp. P19]